MDIVIISAVIETLNTIEVHGKSNMQKMIGCISALEKLSVHLNGNAGKEKASKAPEMTEPQEVTDDGR